MDISAFIPALNSNKAHHPWTTLFIYTQDRRRAWEFWIYTC